MPEIIQYRHDDLAALRVRISELDEQVSNLRRLEDVIRRNNGLFEALIAASRDGIVLTSPDAMIIRVIKSVLGYGSVVATGRSIYDIVYREDREAMRECYAQVMSREAQQVPYEVRALKLDGSMVWIEGTLTDMLDDPNVLGVVHNFRDVTHRREAEIARLELAAVIEQAPFAFFSKDVEGYIQSWNTAAERLFGYPSAEIVGEHIWKLVPDELQVEENRIRIEVIERGVPVGPRSTLRRHKNGSVFNVELTLMPMIKDGRVRGTLHLSQKK